MGKQIHAVATVLVSVAMLGAAFAVGVDAVRPMAHGHYPNAIGLVLSSTLALYTTVFWLELRGTGGRFVAPLHRGLVSVVAVVILAGAAVVVDLASVEGLCGAGTFVTVWSGSILFVVASSVLCAETYRLRGGRAV